MKTQMLELFVRSLEALEAKVAVLEAKPSSVPAAQSILDGVLEATNYADAWEADTLTDEQRREVLEAVSVEGQAWLRREAEGVLKAVGSDSAKALFGDAKAKVGKFFRRAGQYIRELVTAGVLAITGPGPANQTEAIVQATQVQVKEQLEYLDKFKDQIISEAKPLTQEFVARAEMYGAAVWSSSLEVERQGIVAADKANEVLRVLDETENHCLECPPLAELGWVRMTDATRLGVVPLGRTKCKVRCRCYLRYR